MQIVVHFAKAKDAIYRVGLHQNDEECYWYHQVPLFALEYEGKEAHVEVGVESGYLPHNKLYCMPSIELEDLLFVDFGLYQQDGDDLPGCSYDRVQSIDPDCLVTQPNRTFVRDENKGADKHDGIVDCCCAVENCPNKLHLMLLKNFHGFWIVFELESFMLSVNEGFPDPNWEDNLLPSLDVVIIVLIVQDREGSEH